MNHCMNGLSIPKSSNQRSRGAKWSVNMNQLFYSYPISQSMSGFPCHTRINIWMHAEWTWGMGHEGSTLFDFSWNSTRFDMICYSSMFYVLILLQDTQSAMPGYCTWGSSLTALQSLGISLSGSCFENPICISDSEDGPSAPSTVSSSSAARGIRMTSCESQSQVESQASQSRESQVSAFRKHVFF